MKKALITFLKYIGSRIQKLIREEENSCCRCGVCHHVCQLLKSGDPVKIREE